MKTKWTGKTGGISKTEHWFFFSTEKVIQVDKISTNDL